MKTPNLELPEVPEAILGASDEINEGFWSLDAVVQLSVLDKDLQNAPVDAPQGARYIVPIGGIGLWAAKDRSIAFRGPLGWRYFRPRKGWVAYVEDENSEYRYDGTAWALIEEDSSAAPNELDILTTQGDLLTKNDDSSPDYVRFPRGANGQVLHTDDTEASGLVWRYPGPGGGSVPLPNDARVNYMRVRITMGSSAPAEVAEGGTVWNITAATNVLVAATNSATPLLANAHRRHRSSSAAQGITVSYQNNLDVGPCVSHAYANRAGFTYQWIGGIDSMMSTGASRFWIALHSQTGIPGDVEPSANTNFLGLAADTTDTNAQFIHNDGSGTGTKINLGITKLSLVGKLLVLTISCPVGGGSVSFSLFVVDDDTEYTGTASTNLPAAGVIIIPRNYINDTINAETAGFCLIDALLTWSMGIPAGV